MDSLIVLLTLDNILGPVRRVFSTYYDNVKNIKCTSILSSTNYTSSFSELTSICKLVQNNQVRMIFFRELLKASPSVHRAVCLQHTLQGSMSSLSRLPKICIKQFEFSLNSLVRYVRSDRFVGLTVKS